MESRVSKKVGTKGVDTVGVTNCVTVMAGILTAPDRVEFTGA